jgi:hypothetical protein
MSTQSTVRRFWRRGQRGWPKGFAVAQLPNAPLIAAFAAWIVAALTSGDVHAYARAAFYTGLAAWAYGELADGSNWVRRVLGGAGLIYVVARVGAALAG